MKQAQGVGLNDLGKAKDAAQFLSSRWNLYREQCVASLSGSNEMADRADAADACHQCGHFAERATLAEFFEPTELSDMELRVINLPLLVEVQGDFGMALNAGHRIDNDGSAFCHDVLLIHPVSNVIP